MKTVFKSRELAHVWWHQSVPRGRSPGAMSFDGNEFKSYSTTIAVKGVHKKQPFVIINNKHYSNTTTGHLSSVRQAIPRDGVKWFHMGGQPPSSNHGDALVRYHAEEIEAALKRAAEELLIPRHQKRAQAALNSAEGHRLQALDAKEFFGVKLPKGFPKMPLADLEAEAKKQLDKQAKREREAAKEAQEDLQEWLNGGGFTPRLYSVPVMLRAKRIGENADEADHKTTIETTKGASFPYEDGKRGFQFAIKMRERGWRRNGETFAVGNYQLDSITDEGVIAGCHRVSWSELERFAKIEGWIQAPNTSVD